MNIRELKARLIEKRIPTEYYSLDGGYPNEAYCIGNTKNKWEVYYSERGNKSSLKMFDAEEDACNYFYNWLFSALRREGII